MTELNILGRANSFTINYLYVNVLLSSLISNIKWRKSLVCIKSDKVISFNGIRMKRLSDNTNLTFFLAFGDDITGGQPFRNLSKHGPQLTRRSALKQHLREEVKQSENQGCITFPSVTEQNLSIVVWIIILLLLLMNQARIVIVWLSESY